MNFPTNLGDEYVIADRPTPSVAVRSSRSFRQLKDSDAMPFGAYRGTKMSEVPASYLDRLRDANWLSNYPAVEEYIERCGKAIDLELSRKDSDRDRPFESNQEYDNQDAGA